MEGVSRTVSRVGPFRFFFFSREESDRTFMWQRPTQSRSSGWILERALTPRPPLTPRQVLEEAKRLDLTTPREAAADLRRERDDR